MSRQWTTVGLPRIQLGNFHPAFPTQTNNTLKCVSVSNRNATRHECDVFRRRIFDYALLGWNHGGVVEWDPYHFGQLVVITTLFSRLRSSALRRRFFAIFVTILTLLPLYCTFLWDIRLHSYCCWHLCWVRKTFIDGRKGGVLESRTQSCTILRKYPAPRVTRRYPHP